MNSFFSSYTREVYCEDALQWLPKNRGRGAIITSLPDLEEIGFKITAQSDIYEYINWFWAATRECLEFLPKGVPAVFLQTDRKGNGKTLSKFSLLYTESPLNYTESPLSEFSLLFHKIVLRTGVGKVDLYRPTYSHLIAIGDKTCKPGKATPDVIENGGVVYKNGFPLNAARLAVNFMVGKTNTIIDPFCGRGTILAVANELGFNSIGVDIDETQCIYARNLKDFHVKK
jgi:hypothetical protein